MIIRLVNVLSLLWYRILNIETSSKLRFYKDKIYSSYIKHSFSFVGRNFYCQKSVNIIGSKNISIGDNVGLGRFSTLSCWVRRRHQKFHPHLQIGNNCSLGEFNHITCINSITIGHGVLTGRWVTITDNSHGVSSHVDLDIPPIDRELISKGAVIIEDNVWLGDKVTILPGVKIGKGAVVAANAVVSKDVPPYCIAAGVPATIVKKR